jgi:hypothetical protein
MHMKRLMLALVLVSVSLLPLACGKDSNPMAPSTPVVANYAGNWTGTYTMTGCTQSGSVAYANLCSVIGQTPPFSMSLTQSGASVSGTFTMGYVVFSGTSGTVGADGSLKLTGTSADGSTTTIVMWALNNSNGKLSGTMTMTMTSTGLTGSVIFVGIMNTAIR